MALTMLPINAEEFSFEEVKKSSDLAISDDLFSLINEPTVDIPQKLEDLDTEDSFTSVLSVDAAAALKIPFGTGEANVSRKIFVQDYLRYKDLQDNEKKVRWGVGIRWIVNIKQTDVKADISSLPFVAASAQFGYVQAEARFQVLGLSSKEITTLTPAPSPLNTESFAKFDLALNEIKKRMWDENTIVKPKLIAILGETLPRMESKYEESLAITWALSRIKDGDSLQMALIKIKGESPLFADVVTGVYIDVVKSSEERNNPDADAQKRAERLLKGIYIKS